MAVKYRLRNAATAGAFGRPATGGTTVTVSVEGGDGGVVGWAERPVPLLPAAALGLPVGVFRDSRNAAPAPQAISRITAAATGIHRLRPAKARRACSPPPPRASAGAAVSSARDARRPSPLWLAGAPARRDFGGAVCDALARFSHAGPDGANALPDPVAGWCVSPAPEDRVRP